MKKTVVALITLLPALSALAVDNCNNAQTQSDMNQCASQDYQRADKLLNQYYQQALKLAVSEQKALLQAAQKKWIQYRDADCQLQTFKYRSATIYPLNLANCMANKTEQRAKELKLMLNCPEGEVDCTF